MNDSPAHETIFTTMPLTSALPRALVVAAVAALAGLLLGVAPWQQPNAVLIFSTLLVAAVIVAAYDRQFDAADASKPPAFVCDFTALLLFGQWGALLTGIAGVTVRSLGDPRPAIRKRILADGVATVAAIQAAGVVHHFVGGTTGQFVWPWDAAPVAATVLAAVLARRAIDEVVSAILARRGLNSRWTRLALQSYPTHLVAACVAAALADLFQGYGWTAAPVVAIPLYIVLRAYGHSVGDTGDMDRDRTLLESLDAGACVLDAGGRVVIWNSALATITGCPVERALGRLLINAAPALAHGTLQESVSAVLKIGRPILAKQVHLPSASGCRTFQVNLTPNGAGVTLLWQELTDQRRSEERAKRSEDRLKLLAAGTNDGLWEWNLDGNGMCLSDRWKALVGVPSDCPQRTEEWFQRVHPDDRLSLTQAIQAHLSGRTPFLECEHRIRLADGSYGWFLCRGVASRGPSGRPLRMAGSLTNTTDKATAEDRIRNAVFRDPLTGLRNRTVFVERLGELLDDFRRQARGRFAVLYLDLDRFKVVNDSLGHLIGDELLIAVSRRLESCLRPGDVLARLGGDEFAILLDDLNDTTQANAITMRIQSVLGEPFSIGGKEVFTSASIGIAFSLTDHRTPDEMMRAADIAMYQAKARGKARHEMFDADMRARALDRLSLENDLRHAVTNRELELHYQPIVSLSSRRCTGFETLVRWNRNGTAVSPATFIPIAEELGLIDAIGTWVLEEACQTFASWRRRFGTTTLECVTVNVSARQLMNPRFPLIVENAVSTAGLAPKDLRLEVTETALMDSPHSAAELLRELRSFGVKVYLDDFGTGYSSLSHLHKLPVDALKIDRSFVMSLLLSDRPAIVESILALARTLNTGVVAEGVESRSQAIELERLGCQYAQGFFFSRPLTTRDAEQLLAEGRALGATPDETLADYLAATR